MDNLSLSGTIFWWIGVVALFAVVIPLVLLLVQRVLTHLLEIKSYASDVLSHGVAVTENLEPVPALLDTRDLIKSVGAGLGRYVEALNRLLRGGAS